MKDITSIVILSYNTLRLTQMCIESIRGFTEQGTYEIIVIDNASTDGSAEWLQKQKDIKCIFNKENYGFPKGCNQGMAIAEGSEILLLNSDVIVTPRWLRQMKKALYSSDDIGAVSCFTSSCSNWQQISIPYDKYDFQLDEILNFAEGFNQINSAKWYSYFTLVGFCMLFRTSLYKKIGELDEAFSPGNYEDDDYSIRMRLAGYRLLVCGDTFIHHFGSSSFVKHKSEAERRIAAEKYNNLLQKNRKYFLKKWNFTENYKNVSLDFNEIKEHLQGINSVLIIGNDNVQDVFYLSLIFNNIKFSYVTNNPTDVKLLENDFDVYYNDNIIHAINMINYESEIAIILKSISVYNEINDIVNTLKCKVKKIIV